MAALNHSSLMPDAFAWRRKAFKCKTPRYWEDVKKDINTKQSTNLKGELEKFDERRLICAGLCASLPCRLLCDSDVRWLYMRDSR